MSALAGIFKFDPRTKVSEPELMTFSAGIARLGPDGGGEYVCANLGMASITDGINVGYTDYLHSSDTYRKEAEAMIGSAPLGSGLLDWIKRSPLFNMDRVTTPLRVVATRSGSLIEMWEPYALLDAMHKPVDLIVLNTNEHVITDPKIRLAAQGGNLDWFRFWLQGYEDPDPAKAEQYARWQTMRGAQGTR